MTPANFKPNDQYFHIDHPAFPRTEIFTVEKVCETYITVQSSLPRWRDAPMIVTDKALAVYRIQFIDSAVRHAMASADKAIAATEYGQEIRFEELV